MTHCYKLSFGLQHSPIARPDPYDVAPQLDHRKNITETTDNKTFGDNFTLYLS